MTDGHVPMIVTATAKHTTLQCQAAISSRSELTLKLKGNGGGEILTWQSTWCTTMRTYVFEPQHSYKSKIGWWGLFLISGVRDRRTLGGCWSGSPVELATLGSGRGLVSKYKVKSNVRGLTLTFGL